MCADWPETYSRFDTRMAGLMLGALMATLLGTGDHVPKRLANLSGILATGALLLALTLGAGTSMALSNGP